MSTFFLILAGLSMLGVVVSLGVGLVAMGGKDANASQRSNRMMQFRVILQAAAIIFLGLSFMA